MAGESQLFFGLLLAKGGGMSPAYSWVYIKENYGTVFRSYVGDIEVEILFFRARTEIRTFRTALIMRFSSKEISHNGVPHAFHDEFISCM